MVNSIPVQKTVSWWYVLLIGCCDNQAPGQYQGHFAWWSHNHQANLVLLELLQLWFSLQMGKKRKEWKAFRSHVSPLQVDAATSHPKLRGRTSYKRPTWLAQTSCELNEVNCLMAWYSLTSSKQWFCSSESHLLFKSFQCQMFKTHQLRIQLCKFPSRLMSLLNSGGCSFDLFRCGIVPFHHDVRMVQVKSRTWNPKKIKPGGNMNVIDQLIYHPWSCSQTFLIHNCLGALINKRKSAVRLLWNSTLPMLSPKLHD